MVQEKSQHQFGVFGNYSGNLEETRCPTCVSPPAPKLIFKKTEGIGIYECPGCSIQYASPRFDESSLLRIYESESYTDLSAFDHWSYESWKNNLSRGWVTSTLKTQLVQRFVGGAGKILDVGCSIGEFVLVARKNGFDAEGIDNSKMLTELGRKTFDVPIRQIDLRSFHPDYRFKGIVIWDVLEHLYDPVGIMKNCAALLEPGGFIFAQVPHSRGVANILKSFACRSGLSKNNFGHFGFPYHLYFFDKKSLTALMDTSGFRSVHFEAWSHLAKDGKTGLLNETIISLTKKFCLSDYIIIVAQKKT